MSHHRTAARIICNLKRQRRHGRIGATGESGSRVLVKVNVMWCCVNGWAVWKLVVVLINMFMKCLLCRHTILELCKIDRTDLS